MKPITKKDFYLDKGECMFSKYANLMEFGYMLSEENLPFYKAFIEYNQKYSDMGSTFRNLVSKSTSYKWINDSSFC